MLEGQICEKEKKNSRRLPQTPIKEEKSIRKKNRKQGVGEKHWEKGRGGETYNGAPLLKMGEKKKKKKKKRTKKERASDRVINNGGI